MFPTGNKAFLSVAAAALLLLTSACASNRPGQQAQQVQPLSQEDGKTPKAKQLGTDQVTPLPSDSKTPNLQSGKEGDVRVNKPLTLADLHQKYRSTFLFNGPQSERKAALTFDDVPDTVFTVQILDVLKKYGVKATFFVIGNRAAAHPEIVKRIADEGHVIGSHSYSHPDLSKTGEDAFHSEILRTEDVINSITGFKPKLFRPPYGNVTETQILWLASRHYHIINWNVDSLDWKGLDKDQVTANILGHVVPGAVILQHGAGGEGEDLIGTVQALPHIIESLQASGIQLVTVPEIFNIEKS